MVGRKGGPSCSEKIKGKFYENSIDKKKKKKSEKAGGERGREKHSSSPARLFFGHTGIEHLHQDLRTEKLIGNLIGNKNKFNLQTNYKEFKDCKIPLF